MILSISNAIHSMGTRLHSASDFLAEIAADNVRVKTLAERLESTRQELSEVRSYINQLSRDALPRTATEIESLQKQVESLKSDVEFLKDWRKRKVEQEADAEESMGWNRERKRPYKKKGPAKLADNQESEAEKI